MDNIKILSQFKDECKIINFKYEYPGYTGKKQFGIITDLSEKELVAKYSEVVKEYVPYIILEPSYGEIRDEYLKNERKNIWRSVNKIDSFDYEDGEMERYHSELIGENVEVQILKEETKLAVYDALNHLLPAQKRRIIKHYLYGESVRAIAIEEHVDHKAVCFSIKSGIRKIRKILE